MPKDPPRNQPNYKIGGYHLNEYEFEQNHGAITEEEVQFPTPKHGAEGLDFKPEDAASQDAVVDEDDSAEPPVDVDVESPS